MTYQLTSGNSMLRIEDNALVPPDLANTDYQAYLVWLNEGNTPLPAEDTTASVSNTIEE